MAKLDFESFVNDIKTNNWNVFGAEVYHRGELVHSYGDTQASRHPIYSATKTILSLGVGMAWDEGKMDLERCILEYMPTSVVAQMARETEDTFRQITVERLLTMSVAGFPFRPEGDSYLQFSLHCPLSHVEQRQFDYSNIPAYLVGVALTNALGEDAYSYLNRKLFDLLQIENPPFVRCPEGYFYGASGMELTVHELSKIGLLLYHGGSFEGRRIVSEEYVARTTSVQQMNREGGYGYFIWKYRDGFSINGKWKQKCYILPKDELVITYLSHIEDDSNDLKNSMERNLLG